MTRRERRGDRSPLDDYLEDVDRQLDDLLPSPTMKVDRAYGGSIGDHNTWGEEPVIDTNSTPPRGWTGSQYNTPGPSSPIRTRLSSTPSATATEDTRASSQFAERFKYLVCSSGLLEKDFVTSGAGHAEIVPVATESTTQADLPLDTISRDPPAEREESLLHMRGIDTGWWVQKAGDRWDIVVAGGVLICAAVAVVGWKKAVATMACIPITFVAHKTLHKSIAHPASASPAQPIPIPIIFLPRDTALKSLQALFISCSALDNSIIIALSDLAIAHGPITTSYQTALHHLCGEMTDHIASASSSLIPLIDEAEMKILCEMYDISLDGRKNARSRLSDLTNSSGTGPSIDGLEERSGQVEGTKRYPSTIGLGSVPSPRRNRPTSLHLHSPPPTIRPARMQGSASRSPQTQAAAAFGISISQSLPSRAHGLRHARHFSLLPDEASTGDSDIDADHFTAIPQRTPRLSKRASWDVGHGHQKRNHERRYSKGEEPILLAAWKSRHGDDTSGMKRSGSGRRIIHEKRITEADEDGEIGWSTTSQSGDDSTVPTDTADELEIGTPEAVKPAISTGLRVLNLPSSPTLSSPRQPTSLHTPKYTSPLTGRRSPITDPLTPIRSSVSLTDSAIRLAAFAKPSSPPPTNSTPVRGNRQSHRLSLNISPPTGNNKRRSLGNMPYCLPPTSPSILYSSAGMSRTRSLQSDLQDARAKSATGSQSRRTSMSISVSSASGQSVSGLAVPPPISPALPLPLQPRRIPSVSPLSTPALQAACLGVHMKRRRVACALLALKWGETAQGYWDDVRDVLEGLREGTEVEIGKLKEVLNAVKEQKAVEGRYKNLTPPWAGQNVGISGQSGLGRDFAPTTSTKGKMNDHIGVVQKALERAWEETVMVRRHLDEGDSAQVSRSWSGLRDELGIMVRELERGRESLNLMTKEQSTDMVNEDDDEDETPTFLRTWERDDYNDHNDNLTARSTSIGTTATTDIITPNPQESEYDHEMPEVLVPLGADEVFEVDMTEVSGRRDNNGLGKMGREERMGLMKVAREMGLTLGEYLRRLGGGDEKGDMAGEREREEGGKMVVNELKGVIGLIREKKMDLAGGMKIEKEEGEIPFSRFISKGDYGMASMDFELGGLVSHGDVGTVLGESERRRMIQDDLKRAFAFPKSVKEVKALGDVE